MLRICEVIFYIKMNLKNWLIIPINKNIIVYDIEIYINV